jgi:hypothetical protein
MTTVVDGTAGITFPDLTVQATAGYTGLRNRLINGDMRIDQRNSGSQITPTNNSYTLDRWVATMTQSAYFTVQQNALSVTTPFGYSNYIGITSTGNYTLSASDYFTLSQRIEGANLQELAWNTSSARPIIISFWAYASAIGTYGGSISTSAGRSYPFNYTVNSAYIWQYFSISIPADTVSVVTTTSTALSVNFGLGCGYNYTGPANAWSPSVLYQPTNTNSLFTQNGVALYLTGVQLETTQSVTAFERRFLAVERMLCERYYIAGTGVQTPSLYAPGAGTMKLGGLTFPTTMRAVPNVSFSSIVYTNSSGLAVDANQTGFFTATAAATAQGIVQISYNYAADAELSS